MSVSFDSQLGIIVYKKRTLQKLVVSLSINQLWYGWKPGTANGNPVLTSVLGQVLYCFHIHLTIIQKTRGQVSIIAMLYI